MSWAKFAKKLVEGVPSNAALSERDAYLMLGAMLDGGMEALELGALLALFQMRGVTLSQLPGFFRALNERGLRLAMPPAPVRPVVFASHAGTRDEPNLLPLLALALRRFGVPVLVHGALNGDGRVATAHVLRELGVMPCASLTQAETALDQHKLAFVPTAVLAPGMADLLALKSRLGFNDFAQLLTKLLNPFNGEALLAIAADSTEERRLLREFLCAGDFNALLLAGTEGEAFANPRCRPELEYIHAGTTELLFEAEAVPFQSPAVSPPPTDPASTARWIQRVLDGETPLPLPLVNQLACFLYGAGYTDDLNQAKAIVAVETGSLIAV